MVLELLVAFTIQGCPKPKHFMLDGSKWNKTDKANEIVAQKRCVHFFQSQPCLIRFFKRETNTYFAECGVKR